ncbi:MAG TPA: endonuclease/exonuclease/phosphatase family protein, partial [Rugosimonospora sp.]|nr:endonuclease/exonuclease/phosphatase family protein [Rugosimonospora sp.]
ASALTLACAVLPRARRGTGSAGGGPALRVLTSNLLFGAADLDEVLSLVRTQSVDLLALQECTPEADKALRAMGLDVLLPYRVACPRDEPGGSALYSRFPLCGGGYRDLPPHFGQSYATLRVPGAAPVHVESVHPCAPSARRLLRHWWTGLAGQPRPVPGGPPRILLGDFNATLDHVPLRRLLASGYRDAAALVGKGFAGTWPYHGYRLPPVTLDHVLVEPGVGVHAVSAHRIRGTDHRALLAVLSLPPGGSGEDVDGSGDDQRHGDQ